ncbi:hypothetical protein [Acinetobacter baumannii]|uniref:hypothetical protein n=1 Tax=Acinetobacter baumannii TaxID=470 RepID=UPI00338FCFCD
MPNGRIVPTTKLGNWMLKELKLDKPQHEIIYNLEQLDKIIDELQELILKLEDLDLYRRITSLLLKYRAYIRQLSDIR